MSTAVLTGAYSIYTSEISAEAKLAFEQALAGHVGVEYSPVAVSYQVVSGVNYNFFCNAKIVVPNALNEAAIVSIYAPIGEPAHVTRIQNV